MRSLLVPLLAAYAVLSTGYFIFHTGIAQISKVHVPGVAPSNASEAEVGLPVAPPFREPNRASSTGPELLARVQLQNELRYTDLQSFICSERMQRYKARLDGQHSSQIDIVDARVSFENGVENYTGVEQDNHHRLSLSSIPGAWSEGEFGTLLRQTRSLLALQPLSLQAVPDLEGVAAVTYTMDVAGQDSPWELVVSNNRYRVPFRTVVSVAKNTGDILQITRTSAAMPPETGISELSWSVTLKPVEMDGKSWLLPAKGRYSVLYEHSNRREWNDLTFTDYHRYTSSSVMHF